MRSKRELTELLGAVDLFSRCSRAELKTVTRHVETVRLDPGIELTHQGDPGDAFYVILDGHARVTLDGDGVDTLGPGQYFGELALLDKAPRNATVTALTGMEVVVLGQREFGGLIDEVPGFARKLLAGMARRLRDQDAKSVQ